jgi:MFS superfamily sulfate permease-like transporter
MKVIAAIMITQRLGRDLLPVAGLVIALFFLMVGLTHAIDSIYRIVPRSVVRGIQLGLGLNLLLISFNFIQREGLVGYAISIIGIVLVLILRRTKRFPPVLAVLALGIGVSVLQGFPVDILTHTVRISLPQLSLPKLDLIVRATVLLAIPQIPLTIGNAVIATSLLAKDYFPNNSHATVGKLSVNHGIMNLFASFFGGIPVCHGAGGLAAHYTFGARTGTATVLIGIILTLLGLVYGHTTTQVLSLLPFSILGVLLLFPGLELVMTTRDVAKPRSDFYIALFVGAISVGLAYGYAIGLIAGALLAHAHNRLKVTLAG